MYITTIAQRTGDRMKIAVATVDGIAFSQHFGQSKGFVVFETDGTTVLSRELRTSSDTPHNQGICHHSGENQPASQGRGGIRELLSGVTVLLCGGMGAGAAQSLQACGIDPVILSGAETADDAVAAYLRGNASKSAPGFCNCQH
jgi:predicted Fe-Mo cluster-binding NifX family protein